MSSLLSLLKCTEVFYAPHTSISIAAPLEFKINFQIENGNLWICIMSFFNEKNIEVYSWRCIATNANEGWTNQLQFEEILQTCYLILKTIMILILLPNFSIPYKYLILQFRVHIELQNLRRKHPVLKTLNFPEVVQYVVCIQQDTVSSTVRYPSKQHGNTWYPLKIFLCISTALKCHTNWKKKKVVYSTCHFP